MAALEESVVSPDEIAVRSQAGEICPATKLETIGYTDGTTRERLWHCNQLSAMRVRTREQSRARAQRTI
jgi:hypothetical protein